MSHLHRPTAIVLRVLLNRYNKRVLYISHGYKFPSRHALRKPSLWGEGGGLPTDEGLNSLCHKPLTTAARSLSPRRSHAQSVIKQKFEAVKHPYKPNLSVDIFFSDATVAQKSGESISITVAYRVAVLCERIDNSIYFE